MIIENAILSLLSAVFAMTVFSSGTKEDRSAKSNIYVLVHGAWQGPYVWDVVRADLEKKGNKVIVVELPGHGNDKAPTHTLSLDAYSDKVIQSLSKVDGKVILVGHSMGGMVITHVAEKAANRINRLVYVGAFLPASGQALTDLAYSDPDSKLGPNLVPSADELTLDVKKEHLVNLFINDGTQATKNLVISNYRAEPAIPFTNKVTLTDENFGAVDKVYIKTLQDVVISPGLQSRMIAAAGIKTVLEVNSSHSPFLSQPHKLSELLLKVGK
jgi:pimeloyl-ACP methyl ester carboxylesterase